MTRACSPVSPCEPAAASKKTKARVGGGRIESSSKSSTNPTTKMKSTTTALLVTVPSAAAWLSKSSAVSYHIPLHLHDEYLTLLSGRRGDADEADAYRSRLEKVYTPNDSFFDDFIEDDAILFLRAREEGAAIISGDFLTSNAGIRIGMWSEEGDICRNREECEVRYSHMI